MVNKQYTQFEIGIKNNIYVCPSFKIFRFDNTLLLQEESKKKKWSGTYRLDKIALIEKVSQEVDNVKVPSFSYETVEVLTVRDSTPPVIT